MNFSLTERRTVVRALPRAVAAELAERFSHAVEVAPTFDRRRYKLTARGYVGWVRVGGHTITFRPKRPWHEVRCLFGGTVDAVTGCDATRPVAASTVPQPDLLSLLATRLAALMLDRAAAGLARGYVEREITAGTLRGRIDLARQLRQPTLQPTLFDQIADEWTPDIPCNRIPKATALRLLAEPGLSGEAREALTRAVAAFAEVSDSPASVSGPPPEPYRELLDWCDLIGTENVLVSLERAFEGYVTRAFREALGEAVRPQRWIELQPDTLAVGSRLTLTPDLTVLRDSIPVCVWDAKWKRPEPTSSDVHQALAYAAVLGVPACGLVYPGRRWKLETLTAPSGVTLQLLRLPLTDDSVPWRRAVRRIVNLP